MTVTPAYRVVGPLASTGTFACGVGGERRGSPQSVTFLYSWDWSHEFADYIAGEVPAHRLFGAGQMWPFGVDIRHCRWGRWPRCVRSPRSWQLWQGMWTVLTQRHSSVVVATTEASAFVPLLLRRLGLLRRPVITVSVAILRPSYGQGWRRRVVGWLLGRSDLVLVYARAQTESTARTLNLPAHRVRFVPLGVDTDFFRPRPNNVPPIACPNVLSVGTNEGKDYPTLLRALSKEQVCLVVTDEANAAAVRSTRTDGTVQLASNVKIRDLRDLYAGAEKCVIPLREIPYSSGQTVLLEQMAMGADVTVTDVSAVRDYVGDVARLVPEGDSDSLKRALQTPRRQGDPRAHVRAYFTSERFSRDLAGLCLGLAQGSADVG